MIISHKKRLGYSLIEMLAVMSALLLVLTLSAFLMHQSLLVDRGERARSNVGAGLERLAQEFRADLHDSTGPIDCQDAKLTIPQANGRVVEYLAREKDVLRTLNLNGKPRAHETYLRPKNTTLRFVSKNDGGSSRVAIVLQDLEGKVVDPIHDGYTIEAEVGRHSRMISEGAKR